MGDVHQGVVDADAAAHRAIEHLLTRGGVAAKPVQGQGTWSLVDVRNGLVQRVVGQHRQHRTENFFLHELHAGLRVKHQHRQHLPCQMAGIRAGWRINRRQPGTQPLRIVQQALEPVMLTRIDDGCVIRIPLRHRKKSAYGA